MSASEKLKALDPTLKDLLPTCNYYFGPGARTATSRESVQMYVALKAYRNALPQIVAVVEAAERAVESLTVIYTEDQPLPEGHWLIEDAAALAALDEALS